MRAYFEVGHRVGHVPRGLMYLLIQEASRVSEVLGVITKFRRVFSTTQIGRSCSVGRAAFRSVEADL